MTKKPIPKCLVCPEPADGNRGLCVKHYEQFRRKKESLPLDRREEWEQLLIKAGKLRPNRQGKKLNDEEDVFATDFENFLASKNQTNSDVDIEADKIEKVAKKHAIKDAASKPVKSKKKQG